MVAAHDAHDLELLQSNLKAAGHKVILMSSGEKAVQKVKMHLPDLIVADVVLRGLSGLDLCKLLKWDRRTADIPIIILGGKPNEIDRILALELGADHYMAKPFNSRELLLLIDRLLRRQQPPRRDDHAEHFTFGVLSIDIPKHEVSVAGKSVGLTPTEFKLLTMLAQRRERVQSRDQLLQDIWGYDGDTTSRTVDTHMRRLRSKLGRAAKHLHTVRGFGYRFVD